MISVDEARETILSYIKPIETEKIDIISSLGRICAEDIYSRYNIPPFANSAMDGFAVKYKDIQSARNDAPAILKVIEDLPAGYTSKKIVGEKEAVRIMTGACLPSGADTVVKVEDTSMDSLWVKVHESSQKGSNIRSLGEDIKEGELVISQRTLVRPQEIGILATLKRAFIRVFRRPRVAILATGDELIDVDGDLCEGKIVSSNSYSLAAQVLEAGGIPIQLGIAKDERNELKKCLLSAIDADIIVTSGGVSVGDYDFVKDVLNEIGGEMVFWKVAMRPGQPLVFGMIHKKPTFGLPGNPVSSMVSFECFVRPSILKMAGHKKIFRPIVMAHTDEDLSKKEGLRYFLRAVVREEEGRYVACLTGQQGSGILTSMVHANGLIILPENKKEIKKGEVVPIQIIDTNFYSRA